MNLRSLIWGSEAEREAAREKGRLATERQLAEAREAVAELGELKNTLVARANGALYELKAKKGGGNEGESKA